ncbi:MAG: hypothetical protein ACP5R3_06945 [Thermoplasmata archaeon]
MKTITIIFDSGKVSKISFTEISIFKLERTKDPQNNEEKKVSTGIFHVVDSEEGLKSDTGKEVTLMNIANFLMWTLYESNDKFIVFVNDHNNSISILKPSIDHIVNIELND